MQLRGFLSILFASLAFVSGNLSAFEKADGLSALETDPTGWEDIMPDQLLKGWRRIPVPPGGALGRDQWHVDPVNKLLVCDGDGGHDMLLTEAEYGDVVFHIEFRYTRIEGTRGYNSGAYVRNSKDGAIWHQAQIGDASGGFLFGVFSLEGGPKRFKGVMEEAGSRVKPAGEWNVMEITAKGRNLTLWVNGAVTCRFDDCQNPKGHIGLEGEGFRIEFRNLKVKKL
jgi:hypothetical protein